MYHMRDAGSRKNRQVFGPEHGCVVPDLMQPWLTAGATGFGLGSALYKPGATPLEVLAAARRFVGALHG